MSGDLKSGNHTSLQDLRGNVKTNDEWSETMNFANRINQLLAASIGVVNAILAVALILLMIGISIYWFGMGVGIFVGLLAGAALAVSVCGTLGILINIRDLLEQSLRNRS